MLLWSSLGHDGLMMFLTQRMLEEVTYALRTQLNCLYLVAYLQATSLMAKLFQGNLLGICWLCSEGLKKLTYTQT